MNQITEIFLEGENSISNLAPKKKNSNHKIRIMLLFQVRTSNILTL